MKNAKKRTLVEKGLEYIELFTTVGVIPKDRKKWNIHQKYTTEDKTRVKIVFQKSVRVNKSSKISPLQIEFLFLNAAVGYVSRKLGWQAVIIWVRYRKVTKLFDNNEIHALDELLVTKNTLSRKRLSPNTVIYSSFGDPNLTA